MTSLKRAADDDVATKAKRTRTGANETTLTEIDPEGNLSILIGPAGEVVKPQLTRINSHLLKAASGPFRAMLGPGVSSFHRSST